jgi:signal transduction histidine kinase
MSPRFAPSIGQSRTTPSDVDLALLTCLKTGWHTWRDAIIVTKTGKAGGGFRRASDQVSWDTKGPSDSVSDRRVGTENGGSRRVGRWVSRVQVAVANSGWPRAARWRIANFALVLGLAVTVIWSVTGASYFWPGWIWLGLTVPFALDRSLRRALRSPDQRPLAVHAALSLVLGAVGIFIWLMGGLGYFWPIWLILGLILAFGTHAWVVPLFSNDRERALEERVDVLTRTRRDALDVQEAELRRVERDLHDGAQAQLVSLGMSLGMASDLLDTDPVEARRLLGEARTGAAAALAELRSLVRAIYPPVLADRGLDGAIQALVLAVPLPVETSLDLPDARLSPSVESAAYFAVAEALTNVVKHSHAQSAWIQVSYGDGTLCAVVGDDGEGGADRSRGTGLQGIERRLAAFDGILHISSPPGGPTTIGMEVPCELLSPKISPS